MRNAGRSTISHHARPGGRYQRVGRGLYRLRHNPSSAHEHVVSAWLALRGAGAVVSHDSALELYDLADVIPDVVHLSVPRSQRGQRPRAGVRLHTLLRPLAPDPERTLLDCAAGGTAPEQVELAIGQALGRAITTPGRLKVLAIADPSPTSQNGCPARGTDDLRGTYSDIGITATTPILGLFRCPRVPARWRPGTLVDAIWQLSPVGITRCARGARIHPYMLRHSRAMHLYQAGMPLALLTEWLWPGHADPETTLTYAHADTEMKRQALEKANIATTHDPLPTPLWHGREDTIQRLSGLKN